MKRYLNRFELSYEFVKESVYDCLNGTSTRCSRWKRKDTAYFIAEYVIYYKRVHKVRNIPSIDEVASKVHKMAVEERERLYPIVDYIANEMFLEIKRRTIRLHPIKYDERYDPLSKKTRMIGISSMKQQCYDYIAVNALKEMFNAKIGHYQCASLKHKGQLFGKQAIETWIRTNPKKCKWVFKADVRKFYPSVSHSILAKFLKRDIKNKDILYLTLALMSTYEEGLCIGSYLCQYLANYFLSYAYHYVTEMLYVERRGKRQNLIHHALFYMDDIILFGSNKKHVRKAVMLFEKYLNEELGLSLKPTYQLFPLDSRPIDMMGYKIYTYKTIVRKRIFDNANKVNMRNKGKNEITLEDSYKIISYYGYFKHTYSKKYIKKVKLDKSLKIAKEVISNEAKSRLRREAE